MKAPPPPRLRRGGRGRLQRWRNGWVSWQSPVQIVLGCPTYTISGSRGPDGGMVTSGGRFRPGWTRVPDSLAGQIFVMCASGTELFWELVSETWLGPSVTGRIYPGHIQSHGPVSLAASEVLRNRLELAPQVGFAPVAAPTTAVGDGCVLRRRVQSHSVATTAAPPEPPAPTEHAEAAPALGKTGRDGRVASPDRGFRVAAPAVGCNTQRRRKSLPDDPPSNLHAFGGG
jgi:hypothetical protein